MLVRVPPTSTHRLVQHGNSTQGPLIFSPQNSLFRHISSTQIRHFHTNPSIPHKFVVSKRQFNTNPPVPHESISYSIPWEINCSACLYTAFLSKWRVEVTDLCGCDELCESDDFVLKWRFRVELTDSGSWKGLAFVWKWRVWGSEGYRVSNFGTG